MLANAMKPKQIAAEICCSEHVTYDWFYAWQKSGVTGLIGGYQSVRYLAMTPDMIAQRIEAEHGDLPCTLATLAKTLKKQGLTYKRSRYSLKKTE